MSLNITSSRLKELLERYEQLKALEHTKNELVEDLLQRVSELEDAYEQTRLDHDREARFNREVQLHEIELMEQITRIQSVMNQEPFVLVLLDGDGMIFNDSFLTQGEQGGKDAANQLWASVHDYIGRNFSNVQSPKIVARVYANVKGLADVCYKTGIVEKSSMVEDFTRGFNGSRLLFDFVDVGSGKDRADDKLTGRTASKTLPVLQCNPADLLEEFFRLNMYNCHCHQIFFGCSHDNGYARLLEDMVADRDLLGRITLVEGIPFERELASLKPAYRVAKFDSLFRDTKIVAPSRNPSWFSAAQISPLQTQPLPILTNGNGTAAAPATGPATWASTTAAAANATLTDLTASKPSTPKPPASVERNKYGQRVDRVDFKTIPKDELNRVKKLKLCNLFFLLGECPNINCYHTHEYKLTKNERVVLQAVARMTPCHFGTECDDAGCIYGHRCPLSEGGRKDCFWGTNCRFETSAHGIDTNIVKITKV